MVNLISNGILFALASLVFAGFLDVLYKRYARKVRSRGMFLMGMGLTFGFLQILMMNVQDQSLSFDQTTLIYGLAAGLLVTASNILLIESFTHLDVSLGSTIYRLNTVGVVVLSVFFLAETLPMIKLAGVLFAVFAALLLYRHHSQESSTSSIIVFFWIAVLASLLRAGFGVVSKFGLSAGGSSTTMVLMTAICWIMGGFIYAYFREHRVQVTRVKITYSIVTGIVVFLVVNTLYAALARGDASVIIPIANLSFIVALVVSMLLGMERLTRRKGFALALAGISIVLLSRV